MANLSRSKLVGFVSGFEDQEFFVGVDVHKRSYHVSMRRPDGQILNWVAPSSYHKLRDTILSAGVLIGSVAYEAGPTGFGLARCLGDVGIHVIVAAPSRIPRVSGSSAKTDRLDCNRLAEYAAKGLLKPIAVPDEDDEAHRGLVRRRHQIVENIRRTKQRIKSLLLYMGIPEPAGLSGWSNQAREDLELLDINKVARWTLDSHLLELNCLEGNLDIVNRQLEELSKSEKHSKIIGYLRSVPGVGPVVAATFRFEVFQPDRFDRSEEVTSYLGLAPLVKQSGEGQARGRLRPVGQKKLRSLLIEAAWMWKAKDSWANQQYRHLLSRMMGIAQKAIVALARKLAVILWRLCIECRIYRPQVACS